MQIMFLNKVIKLFKPFKNYSSALCLTTSVRLGYITSCIQSQASWSATHATHLWQLPPHGWIEGSLCERESVGEEVCQALPRGAPGGAGRAKSGRSVTLWRIIIWLLSQLISNRLMLKQEQCILWWLLTQLWCQAACYSDTWGIMQWNIAESKCGVSLTHSDHCKFWYDFEEQMLSKSWHWKTHKSIKSHLSPAI